MKRVFSLKHAAAVLLAVFFLASCSGINLPFFGNDEPAPKLEGLVPIASSAPSATEDIRADVVEFLMDSDDTDKLKKHIEQLASGEEANWTNKQTGSAFTVRALEPLPETEGGSRKVVIWGRQKGETKSVVKTYRYHF